MRGKVINSLEKLEAQHKHKHPDGYPAKCVEIDPYIGERAEDVKPDFPGQLVIIREIVDARDGKRVPVPKTPEEIERYRRSTDSTRRSGLEGSKNT